MKLSGENRENLDDFETQDILYAVDSLDEIRDAMGDNSINPPELRNQLLNLHSLIFNIIRKGSEIDDEIFNLKDDIIESLETIIENAQEIYEKVNDLDELLPEQD